MDLVRIGCVQYLNALPLIEGLRAWRGCELVEGVPSRLIGMLLEGEVDVALVSVIDAGDGKDGERRVDGTGVPAEPGKPVARVTMLPVGMIGCDGPTFTVRVFSSVPTGRITRVAVDSDSHTSVALMRIVLKRMYGVDVEVVEFDAGARRHEGMKIGASCEDRTDLPRAARDSLSVGEGASRWHEAMLLIGDKVVTDPPPAARYPYQLDLGAAWKELTGLPFVYAVWMCRAGEEDSPKVRAAAAMLDRSRRHNATRLGWIAATRAGEKRWPRGLAEKYLGEYLRYEVGEPEREAMGRFLEMARGT